MNATVAAVVDLDLAACLASVFVPTREIKTRRVVAADELKTNRTVKTPGAGCTSGCRNRFDVTVFRLQPPINTQPRPRGR